MSDAKKAVAKEEPAKEEPAEEEAPAVVEEPVTNGIKREGIFVGTVPNESQ